MTVKLLTEHHLEFLSFKGGCTGSSESTRVKMPHCWKSHVVAQITIPFIELQYSPFMTLCLGLIELSHVIKGQFYKGILENDY